MHNMNTSQDLKKYLKVKLIFLRLMIFEYEVGKTYGTTN